MELIAVTAGGISVYTYGLINLAAILAGLLAACGNFRLHGQDWKRLEDLLLWGLPLSLLAGRLTYVLCHWNEFSSAPLTTLCFWHGGISYYGVIPALFFTVFAYCQIHGFNPWRWMDPSCHSRAGSQPLLPTDGCRHIFSWGSSCRLCLDGVY